MYAADAPAVMLNAIAPGSLLAPEWARAETLCRLLAASRRGKFMDDVTRAELRALQDDVRALREADPWVGVAMRYALDATDLDILALTLAPDAEPRVAWLYQSLQPGSGAAHPSVLLLQEMLGVDPGDAGGFRQRVAPGSRLQVAGLVRTVEVDKENPVVYPTAALRAAVLGWPAGRLEIPGAQCLEVRAQRSDLVLPAAAQTALDEFLLWVTQHDKVVELWGGRHTGGPMALFSGPSGTGKSLAAEVVAAALGWPLYRVDIGLLVSKYIGETEKNLNALFDAANGQRLVLLFDEADALFGKRGEVKEAHDRYANMEVGHLLTRMEHHHGPCVLTTNLRQALDPAFMRRFQVVIDFPRPDALARSRMWALHLPPRAPLAPDLDFRMLGSDVELTGGQIRNAALHAAYLAAGEGGPIDLPRLARSIWAELGKTGRERMPAALGALAAYLPQEVDRV